MQIYDPGRGQDHQPAMSCFIINSASLASSALLSSCPVQTAQEAADHIRLQIKNSENRKKHEYFLRRQRAFALYRFCLLNKELQSFDSVRSLRLPKNSAEGWLFAVTNKYIAAVLASCGHAQDAKEYFDEALELTLFEPLCRFEAGAIG